jgi:hypothetical protein
MAVRHWLANLVDTDLGSVWGGLWVVLGLVGAVCGPAVAGFGLGIRSGFSHSLREASRSFLRNEVSQIAATLSCSALALFKALGAGARGKTL